MVFVPDSPAAQFSRSLSARSLRISIGTSNPKTCSWTIQYAYLLSRVPRTKASFTCGNQSNAFSSFTNSLSDSARRANQAFGLGTRYPSQRPARNLPLQQAPERQNNTGYWFIPLALFCLSGCYGRYSPGSSSGVVQNLFLRANRTKSDFVSHLLSSGGSVFICI